MIPDKIKSGFVLPQEFGIPAVTSLYLLYKYPLFTHFHEHRYPYILNSQGYPETGNWSPRTTTSRLSLTSAASALLKKWFLSENHHYHLKTIFKATFLTYDIQWRIQEFINQGARSRRGIIFEVLRLFCCPFTHTLCFSSKSTE